MTQFGHRKFNENYKLRSKFCKAPRYLNPQLTYAPPRLLSLFMSERRVLHFFHLDLNHTKMTTKCVFVFIALLFVGLSYAEIVKFQRCPKPVNSTDCTIHEVRVDPCKEAENSKPCKVKRGYNASISFDYTANFEGETLESRAYWTNQVADLAFLGMNSDACLVTQCPVAVGQRQTYAINLFIAKSYPARQFDVKWRLWNDKQQECCFIFQIKIIK